MSSRLPPSPKTFCTSLLAAAIVADGIFSERGPSGLGRTLAFLKYFSSAILILQTHLLVELATPTSAVNKLHVKIRGNKFHELQIFPRNSRNLLSSRKKTPYGIT